MQISSSLRGLTQQAVKQLFTPVSQPREADGNKESGVAPFDRLRAMMAENGGKPSFKILSEFLRMELEDQKAFAEQAGGWLLDIHSQLEDGYRSHGLREVVVHGIHQAAASGQQWNGFVRSGGQTYGLGYGVNPDQVENYAKDAIEDRRKYINWGISRLNEFLEDQESYFKNDPEFFRNLPSSISIDSPEQSEGLSFLSILSDAGVRGLTLTRGADGYFRANTSFTVESSFRVADWNGGTYDYGIKGSGGMGGVHLSATRLRTSVIA